MELPKFSKKLLMYDSGEVIKNPISKKSCELNSTELAVYDYIMGLRYILERLSEDNESILKYKEELKIGLDWFRENNFEAYKILLEET
jgi:hypothetical protein